MKTNKIDQNCYILEINEQKLHLDLETFNLRIVAWSTFCDRY